MDEIATVAREPDSGANTRALTLLIDAGLEFGQAVTVFAARQSDEAKAMIELARERWHKDGEIEIDDNAIAAGSDDDGDYVMAWVWIDNPEEPGRDEGADALDEDETNGLALIGDKWVLVNPDRR